MIIKDGINGILVPTGDIMAVYIGMKKIVSDPDYANKLSSEAIIIRELYKPEDIAKQWLSCFFDQ